MKTASIFLKAATLSVALIGGTAIVATAITPDSAWAGNGNGKGNGGGKDKADRGNGGGKDKSSRGNGGGRSKADRGNSGKSKANRQSAHGGSKSKGGSRSSKSASKRNKGSTKLSDLGRDFKRDVKSLFGRDDQQRKTRTKKRKQASVQPIETSPRPTARDARARPRPEGKTAKKRMRDPLVVAITDPNGSEKLRNLSASKSASAAFANASPNSNVGKIATYQAAAEEYYGLRDNLRDARGDLRELDESYDGRSSEEIEADIAALDPNDPDYETDRGTLEKELEEADAYESARADLQDDIKDLRSETRDALDIAEEAFFDASKGRSLTRDALGDFHDNLGLPEPKQPGEWDEAEIQPLPENPDEASDENYDGDNSEERTRSESRKNHKNGKSRDPLVAAITDPDGSGKLRNLNASKAASAAFANASPNSNVGKIASYQAAATDYYDLRDELIDARRDLRDLDESYDGRTSDEVLEDIAELDPMDEGYEDDLKALEEELAEAEEFEQTRDDLLDGVRDLRKETLMASKEAEEAFALASKGEILTKEALAELHDNLGLPSPTR